MRKIIIIIFPLLFGIYSDVFAQKIKRDVICSSGSKFIQISGQPVKLSCTVGQPPLAGTKSNTQVFLRQGFEQPPKRACADAPGASFMTEVVNDPGCGTRFNFTYTGIPEGATQFMWDFGQFGIPTSSAEVNPQNVAFSVLGGQQVTLTVSTGDCIFTATETVFVTTASDFMVSVADKTDAFCHNNPNGSVMLTLDGGASPYQIDWSNGSTGEEISGLSAGFYEFTATDSEGCVMTDSVEILSNDTLLITPLVTDESCIDEGDGMIELDVTGGESPYQFLWSDSTVLDNLTGISSGFYNVTVTDFNDCMVSLTDIEVKIGCLDIDFRTGFTPNGDGKNDIWIIPGVENFPDNRLEVFNRWGSLVFEQEPYDNSWQGTKTNGDLLPTGAYYFVFMLNDKANTVLSGSVTILR